MSLQKTIRTEIIINASAKQVWSILIDNHNYTKWNPLVIKSEGEIKKGNTIINTLMNGGKTMVFKPCITELEENKKFGWVGNLWFKGLFDGEHIFELIKISHNQTKLKHSESFRGILSSFIFRSIKEDTVVGFNSLNAALKKEAELSFRS